MRVYALYHIVAVFGQFDGDHIRAPVEHVIYGRSFVSDTRPAVTVFKYYGFVARSARGGLAFDRLRRCGNILLVAVVSFGHICKVHAYGAGIYRHNAVVRWIGGRSVAFELLAPHAVYGIVGKPVVIFNAVDIRAVGVPVCRYRAGAYCRRAEQNRYSVAFNELVFAEVVQAKDGRHVAIGHFGIIGLYLNGKAVHYIAHSCAARNVFKRVVAGKSIFGQFCRERVVARILKFRLVSAERYNKLKLFRVAVFIVQSGCGSLYIVLIQAVIGICGIGGAFVGPFNIFRRDGIRGYAYRYRALEHLMVGVGYAVLNGGAVGNVAHLRHGCCPVPVHKELYLMILDRFRAVGIAIVRLCGNGHCAHRAMLASVIFGDVTCRIHFQSCRRNGKGGAGPHLLAVGSSADYSKYGICADLSGTDICCRFCSFVAFIVCAVIPIFNFRRNYVPVVAFGKLTFRHAEIRSRAVVLGIIGTESPSDHIKRNSISRLGDQVPHRNGCTVYYVLCYAGQVYKTVFRPFVIVWLRENDFNIIIAVRRTLFGIYYGIEPLFKLNFNIRMLRRTVVCEVSVTILAHAVAASKDGHFNGLLIYGKFYGNLVAGVIVRILGDGYYHLIISRIGIFCKVDFAAKSYPVFIPAAGGIFIGCKALYVGIAHRYGIGKLAGLVTVSPAYIFCFAGKRGIAYHGRILSYCKRILLGICQRVFALRHGDHERIAARRRSCGDPLFKHAAAAVFICIGYFRALYLFIVACKHGHNIQRAGVCGRFAVCPAIIPVRTRNFYSGLVYHPCKFYRTRCGPVGSGVAPSPCVVFGICQPESYIVSARIGRRERYAVFGGNFVALLLRRRGIAHCGGIVAARSYSLRFGVIIGFKRTCLYRGLINFSAQDSKAVCKRMIVRIAAAACVPAVVGIECENHVVIARVYAVTIARFGRIGDKAVCKPVFKNVTGIGFLLHSGRPFHAEALYYPCKRNGERFAEIIRIAVFYAIVRVERYGYIVCTRNGFARVGFGNADIFAVYSKAVACNIRKIFAVVM